jgi:hypothetical protein
VLSRHPVARLAPLVRYGQHPQLIGLHLVDEIVGKAPQGKPTDGAAEWPPGERECDEELLDMLHFVQELAAKAESLTMIEQSGGTQFLIGERVVADPRHRS